MCSWLETRNEADVRFEFLSAIYTSVPRLVRRFGLGVSLPRDVNGLDVRLGVFARQATTTALGGLLKKANTG